MARKATELPRAMREMRTTKARAMREMRTTKAKAMIQARTGTFRRAETCGLSRQ